MTLKIKIINQDQTRCGPSSRFQNSTDFGDKSLLEMFYLLPHFVVVTAILIRYLVTKRILSSAPILWHLRWWLSFAVKLWSTPRWLAKDRFQGLSLGAGKCADWHILKDKGLSALWKFNVLAWTSKQGTVTVSHRRSCNFNSAWE